MACDVTKATATGEIIVKKSEEESERRRAAARVLETEAGKNRLLSLLLFLFFLSLFIFPFLFSRLLYNTTAAATSQYHKNHNKNKNLPKRLLDAGYSHIQGFISLKLIFFLFGFSLLQMAAFISIEGISISFSARLNRTPVF